MKINIHTYSEALPNVVIMNVVIMNVVIINRCVIMVTWSKITLVTQLVRLSLAVILKGPSPVLELVVARAPETPKNSSATRNLARATKIY